jgi:hypothetical protein
VKRNNNWKCPVKTSLHVRPSSDNHPQHWTDQYGRVLEVFTNDEGKQDLRPIGVDPKGGSEG